MIKMLKLTFLIQITFKICFKFESIQAAKTPSSIPSLPKKLHSQNKNYNSQSESIKKKKIRWSELKIIILISLLKIIKLKTSRMRKLNNNWAVAFNAEKKISKQVSKWESLHQ